jgi:hypothetical protein
VPRPIIDQQPLAQNSTVNFRIDRREHSVELYDGEAVVWISVTARNARRTKLTELVDVPITTFPAMIDTGCNQTCVLHDWHLTHWAGLQLNTLRARTRPVSLHGQSCPIANLDLWLHPSKKGTPTPPEPTDHTRMAQAEKLKLSAGAVVAFMKTASTFHGADEQASMFARVVSMFRSQGTRMDEGVAGYIRCLARRPQRSPLSDLHPRLPLIGMKALRLNQLTLKVVAAPEMGQSKFSLYAP